MEPQYLDGDMLLTPNMPQLKAGGRTAQDMTPLLGSLDGAKESGAAGLGSSGNPDTGGGGNATFLQDDGPWSIQDGYDGYQRSHNSLIPEYKDPRCWYSPYFDPDTGKPISEAHMPGMGTTKAPQTAPPGAVDQATVADQRLKGMWGAQRFHGPAPGQQTGSTGVDDYRNPRLPLPARPPVGSITGPAGWGNGDPYFTVPTPRVPGSPWGGGGAPLLSNPGDDDRVYDDSYVKNIEAASGARAGSVAHSVEESIASGGSGGGGKGNTGRKTAWERFAGYMTQDLRDDHTSGLPGDDYESAADVFMNGLLGNFGLYYGDDINRYIDNHINKNWSSSLEGTIGRNPNLMAATAGLVTATEAYGVALSIAVSAVAAGPAIGGAVYAVIDPTGQKAGQVGTWLGQKAGQLGGWIGTSVPNLADSYIDWITGGLGEPFPKTNGTIKRYHGRISTQTDVYHSWNGLKSVEEMVLQSEPVQQTRDKWLYEASGVLTTKGKDKVTGATISYTVEGKYQIAVLEDGTVVHKGFTKN